MSKNHWLKSLQKRLWDLLEECLVIHAEVPAALVEKLEQGRTGGTARTSGPAAARLHGSDSWVSSMDALHVLKSSRFKSFHSASSASFLALCQDVCGGRRCAALFALFGK